MMTYFLVLMIVAASNLMGDNYPIRTHNMDYTRQFEYKLDEDHLIYVRSLCNDTLRTFIGGDLESYPEALNWHLFDRLGYPYEYGFWGWRKSLLSDNEFISEIAVASEILVAVSNLNRVYQYKPTVLKRPISWSEELGSPFETELYLPEDRRAWSFSCSVHDIAARRGDFMDPREKLNYYSDENGVKFIHGFTATIYVLLGDGQRIVYWDTGLPPSFSRGFLTPLMGTTQGQSLSAAGSTIFISVLDCFNHLRFFTRMYDYEISGACPGFTYTYKDKDKLDPYPIQSDEMVPFGFGQRKLPLEGWREHFLSDIPEDFLSCQVSIHLTGQGNSARELRIQGMDSENRSGYYYKQIDDDNWQFQPDERLGLPISLLFPYDLTAPTMVKDYVGRVIKAKNSNFEIGLKGFHPFLTAEEPSTLTVSYQGETETINLHSVDEWNLSHHKKYHEDLIGVKEGVPKILQATIVLTPEQLNNAEDSLILKLVQDTFLPYHEQTNELQLIADNETVLLCSNDGELKLSFSRSLTADEIDASFYIKRAKAVANLEAPQNQEEVAEQIELNRKTLFELRDIRDQYLCEENQFLLEDIVAILLRPAAEMIYSFEKEDPTYSKALDNIKNPIRSHFQMEWDLRKKDNTLFQAAVDILQARIAELERFLAYFSSIE